MLAKSNVLMQHILQENIVTDGTGT